MIQIKAIKENDNDMGVKTEDRRKMEVSGVVHIALQARMGDRPGHMQNESIAVRMAATGMDGAEIEVRTNGTSMDGR